MLTFKAKTRIDHHILQGYCTYCKMCCHILKYSNFVLRSFCDPLARFLFIFFLSRKSTLLCYAFNLKVCLTPLQQGVSGIAAA